MAELEQEGLQPLDQGGLQVAFGGRPDEIATISDLLSTMMPTGTRQHSEEAVSCTGIPDRNGLPPDDFLRSVA